MLFHVTMDVAIPHDMPADQRTELIAREKAYSQELQRKGTWVHIWRVVGRYSNVSIFDVGSSDELHEILWNLPLFPYMSVAVSALCPHPSAI